MKTLDTIAGKMYVVMSPNGGTVTSADGLISETVEAGKQKIIIGTGAQLQLDDAAGKIVATFKFAPAKLRLLGLLGGGASASALPSGYLAAEFLEPTTARTYITFPALLSSDGHAIEIKTEHYLVNGSMFQGEGSKYLTWGVYQNKAYFYGSSDGWAKGSVQMNAWNVIHCIFENNIITAIQGDEIFEADKGVAESSELHMFFDPSFERVLLGKKRYLNITVDGKAVRQFIPALTPEGNPCMYDKVNMEPFTKSGGTGQFIVGMTAKQALKLADLPAGGGSLTVSLPTGYESDAGVQAALEAAAAKGWDITERTHEAEASAAATFGMRRIWVRRTQNENGMYVDSDGKRWQVDWCVGMHNHDGSEPDAHGYELYRSVDAAVSYWELEPWVDPEAEELLTD